MMRSQARAVMRRLHKADGQYSPLDFLTESGYQAALERMSDAELIAEWRRTERQQLRQLTDDQLLAELAVEQAQLSTTTPTRSEYDDTDG